MDDLLQYFIPSKEKAYKKEIIALNEGAIESKKSKSCNYEQVLKNFQIDA